MMSQLSKLLNICIIKYSYQKKRKSEWKKLWRSPISPSWPNLTNLCVSYGDISLIRPDPACSHLSLLWLFLFTTTESLQPMNSLPECDKKNLCCELTAQLSLFFSFPSSALKRGICMQMFVAKLPRGGCENVLLLLTTFLYPPQCDPQSEEISPF